MKTNAGKAFGLKNKEADEINKQVETVWKKGGTVSKFLKEAGIKGADAYKGYIAGRLIANNEESYGMEKLMKKLLG
jgi:hypothetical protein